MLNRKIDYTLLKADATKKDIENLCRNAKEQEYFSVCINPCYVSLAKRELIDSNVKVCTVIGFPLGANIIDTKWKEAGYALNDGADEFDMVVNLSKFFSGDYAYIVKEIQAVKRRIGDRVLKVILETPYHSPMTLEKIATLAIAGGADCLKTSTGTVVEDFDRKIGHVFQLKNIADSCGVFVKASGGIKTVGQAEDMIAAGASRIGTSALL